MFSHSRGLADPGPSFLVDAGLGTGFLSIVPSGFP